MTMNKFIRPKRRIEDSSPEYKKTKAYVLKRDKYTCQMCNKKRRNLQIHHIMMYAESHWVRTSPKNLITLCYKCHKSIRGKEHYYIKTFTRIALENENNL